MMKEGKTEKGKAKNSFLLVAPMAAPLELQAKRTDVIDIVSALSSEGIEYLLSAEQKVSCPRSSMTLHLTPMTFLTFVCN